MSWRFRIGIVNGKFEALHASCQLKHREWFNR
jgi:hypothetical protein